MPSALVFALSAGVAMAVYSICLRLASSGIHPVLGATVITGAAFLINLVMLLVVRSAGSVLHVSGRSLALVAVVGVAAALADLFTLTAYARGLKVTSSFVIGGTSAALVLAVGFLILREPFTWLKLLAVALILGGMFLLQHEGL
jgi:drug/metabolite transporter (DMT)-like permease